MTDFLPDAVRLTLIMRRYGRGGKSRAVSDELTALLTRNFEKDVGVLLLPSGTSENAVKAQIWTAVSVYVLATIVKKRLHLDASLYTLLQIFSVTLFEKIPLNKGFFRCRIHFRK
jgi:hypothetical protein